MWNLVSRLALSALFAGAFLTMLAHIAGAEPLSLEPRYIIVPVPASEQATPAPEPAAPAPTGVAAAHASTGGGLREFVFGSGGGAAQPYDTRGAYAARAPAAEDYAHASMDPQLLPQAVAYNGPEQPGTIVIDTPQHFLYLVEAGGMPHRYGIGVGRPGFTWAGVKTITAKRE